jgi:hypothetical protein
MFVDQGLSLDACRAAQAERRAANAAVVAPPAAERPSSAALPPPAPLVLPPPSKLLTSKGNRWILADDNDVLPLPRSDVFAGGGSLRTMTTSDQAPLLRPGTAPSCRTDSTAVYGELKSLVVHLALDTILQALFMVLIPDYLIKPHNVLDHIWQCYIDADGKTVQLSAQVYYSTFLNAICSFYDLEEYPINLAGIFQDHIGLSLQKGFHSHYPLYGQTRTKLAITQRLILFAMLNALIKAENDLTNIRDIIRVEQHGGEQFHLSQGQANASMAEKTFQQYGNNAT